MTKVLKTAFFAAAAAFCTGLAFGQPSLPQTIDVPVTFYDFHSDRSNPEFEQPHGKGSNKGHWTGMVAGQLDGDNKPQLGPSPYRNQGIAHWFREWNSYNGGKYGKGKNLRPGYTPSPGIRQTYNNEWGDGIRNEEYTGDEVVDYDTSFKNIRIPGNLTFTLSSASTGMYEYDNSSFFPLDRTTNPPNFGVEWNSVDTTRGSHNFAFTMEMEFPFQVKAGMVFNFRGDDDVWVFIDKNLVLDLGGIHEKLEGSFRVDTVSGVSAGDDRTLRVFYAERHSSGSNLRIQTNIVAPPGSIDISETSNNGGGIVKETISKPADEKKTLYSVVYDDNGVVLKPGEYECEHVTWTITGSDGKSSKKTGCEVELADSIAGQVSINVVYDNKKGVKVSKNANMIVNALAPAQIRVQRDTVKQDAGDDVYFKAGEDGVIVYAVLYDKYGNYVGLANAKSNSGSGSWYSRGDPQWSSDNHDVATVNKSTGSSNSVQKGFLGEGTQGQLTVEYEVCGGTLKECVTLTAVAGVGSKAEPGIAIGPNPFVPGRTRVSDAFPPGSKAYGFYKDVPGVQDGYGVLIGAEATKPLQPGPTGKDGKTSYGKIVIYDAVGNVVLVDALYKAGREVSYGFVWDGKNMKGRYVGPGTYLVRVTGKDAEGKSLNVKKKLGVTK